jgi:hypothetical protein
MLMARRFWNFGGWPSLDASAGRIGMWKRKPESMIIARQLFMNR